MLMDTYAWVELFQGTRKGKKVEKLLLKESCCTSVLSLAEITEWALKNGKQPHDYLKRMVYTSTLIDITENISRLAGKINFENKRKIKNWGMVDSILLATARIYGLKILTGDKHFGELEETIIL